MTPPPDARPRAGGAPDHPDRRLALGGRTRQERPGAALRWVGHRGAREV